VTDPDRLIRLAEDLERRYLLPLPAMTLSPLTTRSLRAWPRSRCRRTYSTCCTPTWSPRRPAPPRPTGRSSSCGAERSRQSAEAAHGSAAEGRSRKGILCLPTDPGERRLQARLAANVRWSKDDAHDPGGPLVRAAPRTSGASTPTSRRIYPPPNVTGGSPLRAARTIRGSHSPLWSRGGGRRARGPAGRRHESDIRHLLARDAKYAEAQAAAAPAVRAAGRQPLQPL